MGQLNNPEQWLAISHLNVQHHFKYGFNCEEFFRFLLSITIDMDTIRTIHVNQSCYCHMQINNLIEQMPCGNGELRPFFLGRKVIPTVKLPEEGALITTTELPANAGTPVIKSDVEYREQQAQNLTDTVVKQVSFEVRRHVEAEVKKLLKL